MYADESRAVSDDEEFGRRSPEEDFGRSPEEDFGPVFALLAAEDLTLARLASAAAEPVDPANPRHPTTSVATTSRDLTDSVIALRGS